MLQILFMILKILGILLLTVLGIILGVLLLVLFVPLRYRVDAVFNGKPEGCVLVSWLLHFVTVRVNYDGSVKALVKVLWFRLFDKTVWPADEMQPESDPEVAEPIVTESSGAEPTDTESVVVEPIVTEVTVAEPIVSEPSVVEPVNNDVAESAGAVPNKTNDSGTEAGTENPTESSQATQASEPEALTDKIVARIQNVIAKISDTCQQVSGKAAAGQEKIEAVRNVLADQENQKTFRLVWKQVKKLLCYLLPRKIRGRLKFGFDDPATTGQILTYVSPFYGLYAKTLELEPVFDEKVIEGELHVKGHIRVASLLWIVIRVLLNKNFRVLLKKVMALGKK